MRRRWKFVMKPKRIQAYRRGHIAEILSAIWLTCKGYRVLKRRYKSPWGEIDLIARRGSTLVFVEVKARPGTREALEAVTPRQRQRIAQAASAYLQSMPPHASCACRFDVMAYRAPCFLFHLRDAWRM